MSVTAEERERARQIACALDEDLGVVARQGAFAAHAFSSASSTPTLHLDDVSGIPFLQGVTGVERYQLRARVRAGAGDLFAATCPRIDSYERYNTERLGLGDPGFIYAPSEDAPACIAAALLEGPAIGTLAEVARRHGSLQIEPYMGIEPVWRLADRLSAESGAPVSVLAPPPPATWMANDKVTVTRMAEALLGPIMGHPGVVDSVLSGDVEALARGLAELALRHDRVALKMPRCASAMGNAVFDGAAVRDASHGEVQALVRGFLEEKQAADDVVAIACAWEDAESSPSSQLWLPREGPPRLDGLYDQLLVGEEQVFLGSVPATLSDGVAHWISRASLLMAEAFQALGYVGRCSFDFIVVAGQPLLVECNGRWGGTSTPMHLMDRLFPGGRPPYRAQDIVDPRMVGRDFAEVADALGPLLFDARSRTGRVILYNVGCLEPYGKLDAIALGADEAEVMDVMETQLPRHLEALG